MVKNYCDLDYRIGTDVNALTPLKRMGVAVPDQVVGDTASVYYTRGDHSRVGDGVGYIDWIWDIISIQRLASLLSYLGDEDWANVYIKSDIRSGKHGRILQDFKVWYGKMWKPVPGKEAVSVARSPYAQQSVKIHFADIVEQPGYL